MRRVGAFAFPMHSNGRRPGVTVLVVDDSPTYRAMAAQALRAPGVEVLVASDGYQALEVISHRGRDIRLLIVDTEMPGMHGWEVVWFARMKAPRMRVLRLGFRDDLAPGAEYEQFRSLPTLAKPFSQEVLLAMVRRLIGREGLAGRKDR
jgi:DNA-binding response OmpR family regulator